MKYDIISIKFVMSWVHFSPAWQSIGHYQKKESSLFTSSVKRYLEHMLQQDGSKQV